MLSGIYETIVALKNKEVLHISVAVWECVHVRSCVCGCECEYGCGRTSAACALARVALLIQHGTSCRIAIRELSGCNTSFDIIS